VAGRLTLEEKDSTSRRDNYADGAIDALGRSHSQLASVTISLAFLAPELVKAAVEGRLPRGIGVARLRTSPRSPDCIINTSESEFSVHAPMVRRR
jgi:hypothetical protein